MTNTRTAVALVLAVVAALMLASTALAGGVGHKPPKDGCPHKPGIQKPGYPCKKPHTDYELSAKCICKHKGVVRVNVSYTGDAPNGPVYVENLNNGRIRAVEFIGTAATLKMKGRLGNQLELRAPYGERAEAIVERNDNCKKRR